MQVKFPEQRSLCWPDGSCGHVLQLPRRTAGLRPEDEWAPSGPPYGLVILFVSPETSAAATKLWPCSYQGRSAEINLSCVSDSPVLPLRRHFACHSGRTLIFLLPRRKCFICITLVQRVALLMTLRECVSIDLVNRMFEPVTPTSKCFFFFFHCLE